MKKKKDLEPVSIDSSFKELCSKGEQAGGDGGGSRAHRVVFSSRENNIHIYADGKGQRNRCYRRQ